ncbi:AraC family transcriptional regulator [Labrys wisconsinensis]|uniref:AraC-like DNA-binding protein n=1 Tax=Labrys wisconsinensis TaxID=425677 RepID=A0ABU0JJD7_9HYPH|nr:AraC family transcriptional regulator [Labrys wisconsinensis]MDQ0474393.1 AraC-like DNA-binding protein [Labrys wisconsinensis]
MKGQVRMLRCRLAGVQAVEAQTRHVFARHSHEHYGIGLIHRGAHRSSSSRGMVEAGAGDIITVNPGEVHDGAPIGDAGRSWRMLYFDPAVVRAAAADISQDHIRDYEFTWPALRQSAAAVPFARLFAALTDGSGGVPGLHEEGLLLDLLGAVAHERSRRDAARSAPAAIRRARGLIDDDPAAPVTLADLARVSGLSRFQVLRGFAAATGLTPHAYLVQRRIDLARRLIGRGTRLADAAAASGFADQSHMTRLFVRAYGLAPGAYAAATA